MVTADMLANNSGQSSGISVERSLHDPNYPELFIRAAMQREDRCGPPCARAHTLQSMRHKRGERLSRGESRDRWLELERGTFGRSESTQENPQPRSRRQKESAPRFGAAL